MYHKIHEAIREGNPKKVAQLRNWDKMRLTGISKTLHNLWATSECRSEADVYKSMVVELDKVLDKWKDNTLHFTALAREKQQEIKS